MPCKISRVSASSWLALKEETLRSVSDELIVVASTNPPAITNTGCSVRLGSMRWLERSRARSALFRSSAMKLGQFTIFSTGMVSGVTVSVCKRFGFVIEKSEYGRA